LSARHRDAGEEDLPAIARIHGHYATHTPATFDSGALTLEAWTQKWRAAGEANHPWLVGEEAGAVFGYAITGPFRPKDAYFATVETSIYLGPEAVGRGAGRALYEALLAVAAGRGFHVAVAGITLPNGASVELHEALGFEPVGVFREVGHKHGDWRDVGFWTLRL